MKSSLKAQPERELRARVEGIVTQAFGRTEENLFSSGVLDSLRAIELGMLLEEEFAIPISDLDIQDLSSISNIVTKLHTHSPALRSK
ncbi:MAG: acyl carrier protein [Kofleriaceae bacterium]